MFASGTRSRSLCKRVRISVTVIFWLLALTNTAILIWSYYTTFLYVKLLIVVPSESDNVNLATITDIIHEHSSPSIPSISNLRIEITEFALSFNELTADFWNGTAYTCALALMASMYVYPYFKLFIYCIVFLVPLKREYQHRAVFHLNQWNKAMFIPLVAVLMQCATVSFPIDLPSHYLQEHTNVNAEAYPGHGMVLNIVNLACYYVIDHVLFFIIHSKHKYISRTSPIFAAAGNHDASASVQCDDVDSRMTFVYKDYILRKYASTSYAGVCGRAVFVLMVIGNVWLNLEALHIATLRFKLQGVLAMFIADPYVINNVITTADILLNTSLLNASIAWFIYVVYYTVFVVCPCVVCVLLAVVWILPLVNKRFAVAVTAKYALKLLWFVQSWNALDIYLLCQFGGTDHNIKSGTKYLLDSRFPEYCGDDGIVTQIFGEDCSWADSWFTYGMFVVSATVLVQWFAIYYTNKIFTVDDHKHSDGDGSARKLSINT